MTVHTNRQRAQWRRARQRYLSDPEVRQRDREAARLRYHKRKQLAKVMELAEQYRQEKERAQD